MGIIAEFLVIFKEKWEKWSFQKNDVQLKLLFQKLNSAAKKNQVTPNDEVMSTFGPVDVQDQFQS